MELLLPHPSKDLLDDRASLDPLVCNTWIMRAGSVELFLKLHAYHGARHVGHVVYVLMISGNLTSAAQLSPPLQTLIGLGLGDVREAGEPPALSGCAAALSGIVHD